MHKAPASMNISNYDELSSIDAHLEYVKRLLKWGISDLDGFISSLGARIAAEEGYIHLLLKVPRASHFNNDKPNYFGDYIPSFQQAALQYEMSVEKIIQARKEYIQTLKYQMDILSQVKESLEMRRKKVKAVMSEKNNNYMVFRTRDVVKLQRTYILKCTDLSHLQQQQHNDETEYLSPPMGRPSSDESNKPRHSSESFGRDMESISSSGSSLHKKGMAGFINQVKTQFANTNDPTKQATKFAKLKKEITDCDIEYRQGIQTLEYLRKKQIETSIHAMRHVEAIFLGKTDALKAVTITVSKGKEELLLTELEMIKQTIDLCNKFSDKEDIEHFTKEYEKLGFIHPERIQYENFYHGKCKDILFGSDLNEYCHDHPSRTVPLIVSKSIDQIEKLGGIEREGIYRVSARQSVVDHLRVEFEKDEECVDLDARFDVFTVASVLKVYFRELKQPLFNFSMNDRMNYSMVEDEAERKTILQNRVAELSKPHRDTLGAIITHLAKVEACSNVNKMTIKNLSVVFTPALFHDHNQAENNGEWYSDKVLEDLIHYHKTLFSDIEKQKQAENASTSPIPSQHNTRNIVNRNSMQSFQSINTSSSTNSGSGPFTYLSRRISTSLKKSNKAPTEDNMSDISTSLSIPEQEVPRSS